MVTASLLVCGAMTMTWLCDTISESGFGIVDSLSLSLQLSTFGFILTIGSLWEILKWSNRWNLLIPFSVHFTGHGSSLIICVGILTGYTETLHKMLNQISGTLIYLTPYFPKLWQVFTFASYTFP